MRKLSYTEIKSFETLYFNGDFYHQRLGQAFYNEFIGEVADEVANLFYMGDDKEAQKVIWEKYWNGKSYTVPMNFIKYLTEKLAYKMQEMVEDRHMCRKMSVNAIIKADNSFNIDKTNKRLFKIFTESL